MSVITLASGLLFAASAGFACDHDKDSKATKADEQHQLHEQTAQQADVVATQRFATNKHLRKSISSIEAAYADATRGQQPSKATAQSLAATVEEGIADIVKHCSLPKDADTALLSIIHEMTAATSQLKAGNSIRLRSSNSAKHWISTTRNLTIRSKRRHMCIEGKDARRMSARHDHEKELTSNPDAIAAA